MLTELHSTHMSTVGMKQLARKKMWWPQMGKDLETVYEACNACKMNSRSKNNVCGKRVEVIPSTMETGELICMDYGDYGRSNLLIIKIRSDQGPCFCGRFTEWNKSVGINQFVSWSYNPQANGAAERGVASIKSLLTKLGKKGHLSQEELDKIVFKLNSH